VSDPDPAGDPDPDPDPEPDPGAGGVLVLSADLLFGSQVQGALGAAGWKVQLIGDEPRLAAVLAQDGPPPAVLVVDLTDGSLDGSAVLERLAGELGEGTATLGYYSHVDVDARERAERAGFDLLVPRSRMAREGAALIGALTAG
jgi:DNA-binding response OmpR family regulator